MFGGCKLVLTSRLARCRTERLAMKSMCHQGSLSFRRRRTMGCG